MSRKIPWQQSQSGYEYIFIGTEPTARVQQYTVIGDRVEETKTVVVHEFSMGDVEDPDLYAAQPLWEWQQSEQGKWVMEHAVETPCWNRMADTFNYGYKYNVTAKLRGARLTEWLLRNSK